MENLAWLVVGVVIGALAAWLVIRALHGKQIADGQLDLERARTETATAQAQAAGLKAQLAEAGAHITSAEARQQDAVNQLEAALADRQKLVNEFKVLSTETVEAQQTKLNDAAEQRFKETERLLAPVKESLARFDQRLIDVEKERQRMTTALSTQVSQVQQTGENLRRETAALVTALRKPQVRGTWGELQLKRVVELAGMVEHCDFELQATTQTTAGTTIRPDLKVMLSDDRYIYVDSKVPLSAFLDAQEAENTSERDRQLGQFAKNVQTHIDQLSAKDYFKAGGATPEFVVLFLGSEALAVAAFNQLPALHEYAAERRVVLATPSSLIALLKTAAFAWRQAALAESAREVFDLARELYDRLGTMGKHFDKVGRALTSAVGAYNDAVGSIEGRVFPTARKLRDLKVTDKELLQLNPVDSSPRPITAGELVDDATEITPMIGRGRA